MKGNGSDLRPTWAGAGLVAAANTETLIRFWSTTDDTNYILQYPPGAQRIVNMHSRSPRCARSRLTERGGRPAGQPKENIVCVAFDAASQLLCAGSVSGLVSVWRYVGVAARSSCSSAPRAALLLTALRSGNAAPSENDWEYVTAIKLAPGEPVVALIFGTERQLSLRTLRQCCVCRPCARPWSGGGRQHEEQALRR